MNAAVASLPAHDFAAIIVRSQEPAETLEALRDRLYPALLEKVRVL